MKGHIQIELKNEKSGKVDVYEQDNMVTSAVAKVLGLVTNTCGSGDVSGNPMYNLLPIGEKALGGIFLFDGKLEESADNVHLTGSAGHEANTESKLIGSLNVAESGRTDAGYVNTWEFTTAQANGVIASLALTHCRGGADPFNQTIYPVFYAYSEEAYIPIAHNTRESMIYLYKDGKVYSKHIYGNVIRVGSPYFEETKEIFDFAFANPTYSSWQISDGYDGYLYAVYFIGSDTPKTINIRVRKVKIADSSFREESEQSFSVDNIMPCSSRISTSSNARFNRLCAISKGYLYVIRIDKKAVYKIDLSNIADVKEIEFEDKEIVYINPRYSGGIFAQFKWKTIGSSGKIEDAYGFGTVYPDGKYLCTEKPLSTSERYSCDHVGTEGDNLCMNSTYNGAERIAYGYFANYLGTICNLSSPVVKTSEQSMKITYTLTDV